MQFSLGAPLLAFFLALLGETLAAPAVSHTIERYAGKKTGRYIVTLKQGVSSTALIQSFRLREPAPLITHQWESVLNGFAAKFEEGDRDVLLKQLQESPDVESIAEDGKVWITAIVTQTNAAWGLGRLSSVEKVPNLGLGSTAYNYTYDTKAGEGTDIYSLDTGVRATHREFSNRARWGAIYGGYPAADGNGHGTHVAAIAIGTQFACAKRASLIAVKVLDDAGSGTIADVISGLNYVFNQARDTRRPSVVTLSLAANPSNALDNAVVNLINSGVHVAVAAGNTNANANTLSPGRVSAAITVGAIDINDAKTATSNFGAGVDVFAPGQNVLSAGIANDSATTIISGTSTSAPFLASAIAYFISIAGNTSPANMSARVRDWSLQGMLTGLPQGTPNFLLTNSYVCGLGDPGAMICI